MAAKKKLSNFARYAWLVLGWNIAVIMWGVFLRASKSGDGCGQHWLTCQGEVVPSAPQLKTIIEFSHRLMSAFDGILMLVLVVWAFSRWYSDRKTVSRSILIVAAISIIFVATEGAIGAGLVLTGNTAETLTAARPFWMAGHLINTFILLAFVTVTAWLASGNRLLFKAERKYFFAIAAGLAGILLVGISGSIAALSSMLFPSESLAQGFNQDFSPTSSILLRLRLLHPFAAIVVSVLVFFVAGWLARQRPDRPGVRRWSNVVSLLIVLQLAFGAATLLTLAPIVMQLGHLFLADSIWVSFVLLSMNFLASTDGDLI